MKQKVLGILLGILLLAVFWQFKPEDSLEAAAEMLREELEENAVCAAVFGLEDRGVLL